MGNILLPIHFYSILTTLEIYNFTAKGLLSLTMARTDHFHMA